MPVIRFPPSSSDRRLASPSKAPVLDARDLIAPKAKRLQVGQSVERPVPDTRDAIVFHIEPLQIC